MIRSSLILTGALLVLPSGGVGQEVPDDTLGVDAPTPEPDTTRWIAVAPRPRSTLVAVTVAFPVGSAQDAAGRGGTARLLAQTLQSMAEEALGPSAEARVTAERGQFRASLLAEPDNWSSAMSTLATVLFRRDLRDDRFEEGRSRLLGRMAFEAGAPVREFEVEAARVYAAGEGGWARPPDGDLEGLRTLTVGDLQQYRRRHLLPEQAVVALVGPVDETGAIRTAAGLFAGRHAAVQASATTAAWVTGNRLVMPREITNAALAFAYPLPPDGSRTDAEFLAHVLEGKLNSDPPDPGVYRIQSRVEDAPAGPLLVIEAAVFPEVGERWEQQIASAVREVALTDADEDVYFPWQQRRFRSHAMGRDAAPEDLGRRLADDLRRAGTVRDLDEDLSALTVQSLIATAQALGEPRILLFGPDMGADRDR